MPYQEKQNQESLMNQLEEVAPSYFGEVDRKFIEVLLVDTPQEPFQIDCVLMLELYLLLANHRQVCDTCF